MTCTPLLSVVIPIGPDELSIPQGLLDDLQQILVTREIIFVTCNDSFDEGFRQHCTKALGGSGVLWLNAGQGRAIQMNAGALSASGEYLWFLHVDSRFDQSLFVSLIDNLSVYPDRLHYCLLQFLADGPSNMTFNGIGANLRSVIFGAPFGDQGFAIKRSVFSTLDGYPEKAAYGEDHLFVWYARQQGVKLKCCRKYLKTSARKYTQKGWFALTCRYQYLWIKQAMPELCTLIKKRYF